mgnify:CR=1 FL=1
MCVMYNTKIYVLYYITIKLYYIILYSIYIILNYIKFKLKIYIILNYIKLKLKTDLNNTLYDRIYL